MSRSREIRRNLDWITILLYLLLTGLGLVAIYSAAYNSEHTAIWDISQPYGKQLMWIGICLVVGFFAVNTEGEFFNRFSPVMYISVLVMLVLVLLIGKKVGGARSWFGIGSFAIQPSEFAKAVTALFLAHTINKAGSRFKSIENRLKAIAILAVPAGLIMLQPDAGTVLVFVGFIFALYREGLSGNILIIGFAALVIAVLSIIMGADTLTYTLIDEQRGIYYLGLGIVIAGIIGYFGIKGFVLPRYRRNKYLILVLSIVASLVFCGAVHTGIEKVLMPHQKQRIYVTFGMEVKDKGAEYNIRNAKAAISSGEFSGKGFLDGPMTQYSFVPEQRTDFIFCTIGEEWGFIGSLIVMTLFTTLIIRMIFLAERQRSQFSRVYGYCVASILFMHLMINVGMVIGLAPVIGIPLPFFSYGGSSLLGFTILIFIMLRLDSERFSVFR
ncbi:MAG: rod shape-determining protein RodA [Flavobacteriales bacterium]|nr:rod shape-determining protein RodA [Flavobacteriales bacterium]